MVSEPGEKRRLFEERGADAVDMETAAVAAVCEQRGVAWGVVRAISDPAGEALPAFVEKLNRPDGRANGWAAVRSILRDPRRIGALARLGYRSRIAGRALSERVAALL
jgi:nucleoside phosphorylase